MKKWILAVLMVLFLVGVGEAQNMRQFMAMQRQWQLGYIGSSMGTLMLVDALCPIDGIGTNEVLSRIPGYLVNDPHLWNRSAILVVGVVLQEVFPCESKGRYK